MVSKTRILFLLTSFLLTFIICPSAKNIYSTPDISKTSNKIEGFTIDFRGIDTPDATYWALCRWNMDLTEFKKTHKDVTGGTAYGGLQTKSGGRVAILSFWEVGYKENDISKTHRANRLYPRGQESTFTGEGEGTNYIANYDWDSNVWYRFYIRSWVNPLTQDTYVGEWIQNLNTKEWTLFAYFNTNLQNSYLTKRLSFFQENFNSKTFGQERSFQIKNMYAYDKEYKKWISLDTTTLSYDAASWGYDTAGTHEIGFTSNYFYGSSGLRVDNQETYDASNPNAITGTIRQPEVPDFTSPKFKSFTATLTKSKISINWSMDSKTSPCYSYQIVVLKYDSISRSYRDVIVNYPISRPEETSYIYSSTFSGTYLIRVTCNALSGESTFESVSKSIS